MSILKILRYIVLFLCLITITQSISILINQLNDTIANSNNCYPTIQSNLCNLRSAFSACLLFSLWNDNCIINLPNQKIIYLNNNIYGNFELLDTPNITINGYDSIIIGNYYSSFITYYSNFTFIPSLSINNIQISQFGSNYPAISLYGNINLHLSNVIFNENQGSLSMNLNQKESRIYNCSFLSNYYVNNFINNYDDDNNSIIINNLGSITIDNSSNIEIIDSSFLSSNSINGGGAIYSKNVSNILIYNSIFIDCNAESISSTGGAIFFAEDNSNLEISNNIFISNSGII